MYSTEYRLKTPDLKREMGYSYGGNYLKVLERDGYKCVRCGFSDKIVVHHKDKNRNNNQMDNLITVCKSCHAFFHGMTLRFNKITIDLINELKGQGFSYQRIGEYLGISRQRVHQIKKKSISETV